MSAGVGVGVYAIPVAANLGLEVVEVAAVAPGVVVVETAGADPKLKPVVVEALEESVAGADVGAEVAPGAGVAAPPKLNPPAAVACGVIVCAWVRVYVCVCARACVRACEAYTHRRLGNRPVIRWRTRTHAHPHSHTYTHRHTHPHSHTNAHTHQAEWLTKT